MKRIFLTLATITLLLLGLAIVLGLNVGDARSLDPQVQRQISTHMLTGLAALTFATLVHAISFTYFMGTGRWIEETSKAYSLPESYFERNQKLKYGMLPGVTISMILLITTGALGAVADPATPMSLDGTMGLTGAQIHLTVAALTVLVNLVTNFTQYIAIAGNSRVVDDVLADVHRIREERGLPV
ncbi:MAG: hypothetical protein KDA81_06995 [Planctomycetaceae bacterium]|nr:hypothetical protein [Planctomycetaceae bacterium]